METALIISVVLLWLTFAALIVVVIALGRQIGILHQRIAPAGAMALSGGVEAGDIVPDLKLQTLKNEEFNLLDESKKKKSVLLTFISPDCSVCEHLMPALKAIRSQEKDWLTVMLASDGEVPEHKEYVLKKKLDGWPYLLSRELGMTFEVSKLPYSVLIDEEGRLVSKGLTNTREHIESLFEAKKTGVSSIQDYLKRRADKQEQNEKQAI